MFALESDFEFVHYGYLNMDCAMCKYLTNINVISVSLYYSVLVLAV